MLWRLISQVLLLGNNLSIALTSGLEKASVTSISKVAAGRIVSFHSFLLTFRVLRST